MGVFKHRDLLVELQDEDAVKKCEPIFPKMKKFTDKMIITAPEKSRFCIPIFCTWSRNR